jgi:hypothetical protein
MIDAGAKPMFEDGLLQNIGEQRLLLLLEIVGALGGKKDSRTMPSCRAQCPQQIHATHFRHMMIGDEACGLESGLIRQGMGAAGKSAYIVAAGSKGQL